MINIGYVPRALALALLTLDTTISMNNCWCTGWKAKNLRALCNVRWGQKNINEFAHYIFVLHLNIRRRTDRILPRTVEQKTDQKYPAKFSAHQFGCSNENCLSRNCSALKHIFAAKNLHYFSSLQSFLFYIFWSSSWGNGVMVVKYTQTLVCFRSFIYSAQFDVANII